MKRKEKDFRFKIFLLCFLLLPETVLDNTLGPLYPFIVRHLMPGERNEGYYVGLLQSAYYFPLLVMNIIWGMASDR
jgi:MFS family permease